MIEIKQNTGESIIAGTNQAVLIFTIAARNYLGQVSVLFDSISEQCGDIKFCCFVVDGYDADAEIPEALRNNVFDCRKLGIPSYDFEEMACKYTVVEFSTALKPYIFKYIFEYKKFNSAVYLDPDFKLYNNTDWIEEELKTKSILLTPHLLNFEAYKLCYTGRIPVLDLSVFLYAGTYNLGFIAIKNDSYGKEFIDFWAEILRYQCFDDSTQALCVDQKWADFLSRFFGERVGVINDPGANVAYWNLHERNLTRDVRSNYLVNGSVLKFIHYSSIDLADNDGISANARKKNISLITYPEYRDLFSTYKDGLIKAGFKERMANMPYRYNYFENGLPITKLHRRIYTKLIDEGSVPSPFSVSGRFYSILKENKLLEQKPKSSKNGISIISFFRYVLRILFWITYRLLGAKLALFILNQLRNITIAGINKIETSLTSKQ